MMSTETLSQITKAEQDAANAAAKAFAAAEAAKARADAARQRADTERALAYQTYLDKLVQEHPEARSTALSAAGESRAALEQAVRTGGGVGGRDTFLGRGQHSRVGTRLRTRTNPGPSWCAGQVHRFARVQFRARRWRDHRHRGFRTSGSRLAADYDSPR